MGNRSQAPEVLTVFQKGHRHKAFALNRQLDTLL